MPHRVQHKNGSVAVEDDSPRFSTHLVGFVGHEYSINGAGFLFVV